jgi:predicted nucleic acid-binding protein
VRKILLDTNVILDVFLNRQPHVKASSAVWTAVENGFVEGMLAAHAITTIHYLVRKEHGTAAARRMVGAILRVFRVARVDADVIEDALRSPSADFEDAVTASAAVIAGCDIIVTRDPKGFRGSQVRVMTPEAAAPILSI